jgi:hypothetical protein
VVVVVGDVQHTRKVRNALIRLDGKLKYHVRDIGVYGKIILKLT